MPSSYITTIRKVKNPSCLALQQLLENIATAEASTEASNTVEVALPTEADKKLCLDMQIMRFIIALPIIDLYIVLKKEQTCCLCKKDFCSDIDWKVYGE